MIQNNYPRLLILLVCLMATIIACIYPTPIVEHPDYMPTSEEIVGVWSSDECHSIKSQRENDIQTWTCSWEFHTDGTFVMEDVPEWSTATVQKNAKISGSGKWTIEKYGYWAVTLDFLLLNNVEVDFRRVLPIHGKHPPYILIMFFGDPDAGKMIEFTKIE